MAKNKDTEMELIKEHGEKVLVKLIRSALHEGNAANQRFIDQRQL